MLPTIRSLLQIRLSRFLPTQIPPLPSSKTFRTFSSSTPNPKETKDDSWDTKPSNNNNSDPLSNFEWDQASSWSTGLTKDHFDGEAVGHQLQTDKPTAMEQAARMDEVDDILKMVERDNRKDKAFVDGWKDRMSETCRLLRQVREPGVRGSYLKDSEKAEMYKLHKENPEVYNVERLAKDFRIMRQRVHAILWLKEMEEEEEKKLGRPLDDSVEILLDNFPE